MALYASQLLEQGKHDDLGIREPLEELAAAPTGVEGSVSVVDKAEQATSASSV
ncbi:MAG: hypothetical protein M3P49_01825 [Actinomycetota bacterium]|nr:hypothetical protein [Actinomycetota bacterium]